MPQLVESLAAAGWSRTWTPGPGERGGALDLRPAGPGSGRHPRRGGQHAAALDGGYVPAGPSGAPTRGGAHVLPTGCNLLGRPQGPALGPVVGGGLALAAELVARARGRDRRRPPPWGWCCGKTAAMRTGGDDAAQALALLGVRPCWDGDSGRVTGLEPLPLAELRRLRVDVTLRISGFFRDAPPPGGAAGRRGAPGGGAGRVTGGQPGGRGRAADARLGARRRAGSVRHPAGDREGVVAHGRRPGRGVPGVVRPTGETGGRARARGHAPRFAAIQVAVKNQDNREHDIFDSDDYLQDHGGMVAAVRALAGQGRGPGSATRPTRRAPGAGAVGGGGRVVRSRVLNPRWIGAMRRHGYKGRSSSPPPSTTSSATTPPPGWWKTGCTSG